jgi:hypothetical protein
VCPTSVQHDAQTTTALRTGDVPDLTAAPALAEKELGFKAPRTLEEMCRSVRVLLLLPALHGGVRRDLWNWQSRYRESAVLHVCAAGLILDSERLRDQVVSGASGGTGRRYCCGLAASRAASLEVPSALPA